MNPPLDEREARIELAAAFRIAVRFDLHEGIWNHVSMLVPGHEDQFLINSLGLHFSEATASSLVMVEVDGTPISGMAPPTGIGIHAPIHRLCPWSSAPSPTSRTEGST